MSIDRNALGSMDLKWRALRDEFHNWLMTEMPSNQPGQLWPHPFDSHDRTA